MEAELRCQISLRPQFNAKDTAFISLNLHHVYKCLYVREIQTSHLCGVEILFRKRRAVIRASCKIGPSLAYFRPIRTELYSPDNVLLLHRISYSTELIAVISYMRHRQTDRRTDRQTDRRTDGRTPSPIHVLTLRLFCKQ